MEIIVSYSTTILKQSSYQILCPLKKKSGPLRQISRSISIITPF